MCKFALGVHECGCEYLVPVLPCERTFLFDLGAPYGQRIVCAHYPMVCVGSIADVDDEDIISDLELDEDVSVPCWNCGPPCESYVDQSIMQTQERMDVVRRIEDVHHELDNFYDWYLDIGACFHTRTNAAIREGMDVNAVFHQIFDNPIHFDLDPFFNLFREIDALAKVAHDANSPVERMQLRVARSLIAAQQKMDDLRDNLSALAQEVVVMQVLTAWDMFKAGVPIDLQTGPYLSEVEYGQQRDAMYAWLQTLPETSLALRRQLTFPSMAMLASQMIPEGHETRNPLRLI